ncbi:MAG: alkyldihydroxyacetonephosphate synthase [Solirubrobacteraceae bacterium]|jgi:alkyldihydroxyacetonephosphate synthase|nr:alkyldihydroxyacetonephosphate synthase [Solirubrobacteraceae bacterium]
MPERPISWIGWGNPADAIQLPEGARELLEQALGVQGPVQRAASLDAVRLGEPRLAPGARGRLTAAVGAAHLCDDAEARIRHTRGKSTPDLLRLRAGEADDAPDAVLRPGSHDEVVAVLRICSDERVAVVPFGGGTSVVGGLAPSRAGFDGVVALDLGRLDRMLALDEESRTATLEPGLRGPEAEALVAAHGFTIGHHPQSFEYATIGGFAAVRSSGQASAGYGRFDDLVLALRVATPAGTLALGRAPRSAAGPDLRALILGSEGAFGVITSVTVELRRAPAVRIYDGWRVPSFADGRRALRRLAQDGPLPTVLRLSDEAETALNLIRPAELGAGTAGGCLAIVGYEGTAEGVEATRAGASVVVRECGGEPEAGAGEGWLAGRYRGPYLRDGLLDAGALVETLETATFWSGIEALYRAASDALRRSLTEQGTPPLVLCHVSHVYPAGASLYFTVACAQLDDPVAQWWKAKADASDAILAAGGTISHHHGVGSDHRKWYKREVGELGVAALRAVKAVLDPAGILNPGVLLPDRPDEAPLFD